MFWYFTRYPVEVAARVVNSNLRPAMLRARNAMYPAAVPNSITNLDAMLRDPAYRHLASTINGGDFLYQGCAGPRGERSAVFASTRMLNHMKKVKEVFVDATFVPTPLQPAGAQVLQISEIYRNNVSNTKLAIFSYFTYLNCAISNKNVILPLAGYPSSCCRDGNKILCGI